MIDAPSFFNYNIISTQYSSNIPSLHKTQFFQIALRPLVGVRVAQILQKVHHEDIVLVLCRIDHPTEGVAGFPGGLVDAGLGDVFGCGHGLWVESRLSEKFGVG